MADLRWTTSQAFLAAVMASALSMLSPATAPMPKAMNMITSKTVIKSENETQPLRKKMPPM